MARTQSTRFGRLIAGAALAFALLLGVDVAGAATLSRDFGGAPAKVLHAKKPIAHKVGSGGGSPATRAQLNAYNATYFIPCGNGCITGAQIKTYNGMLIAAAGTLPDTNPWTGANSWAGVSNFTGAFQINGNAMTFPGAPATLASVAQLNLALPSGTANQIYVGTGAPGVAAPASTLPTAAEPAFTGDVSKAAGSLATTVVAVQGLAYKSSATYLNGQVPTWVPARSDFEPGSGGAGGVALATLAGAL